MTSALDSSLLQTAPEILAGGIRGLTRVRNQAAPATASRTPHTLASRAAQVGCGALCQPLALSLVCTLAY